MPYDKGALSIILQNSEFGNSVAENDSILAQVRVETSVFSDLLHDRVDLIPGTKGSGKSALFRTCTDFMQDFLGKQMNKVIDDLVSIGFLRVSKQGQQICCQIPHVYRQCLNVQDGWER